MASAPAACSLSPDAVRAVIAEALRPVRFFVGPGLCLLWKAPALEEISWEVFRGRLLDPAHTRQTARFTAWNVHQQEEDTQSAEPLLSVKLDEEAGRIHVVRAVLTHVWEGFDAGNKVIESRETMKWVRELVGTVDLTLSAGPNELRDELTELVGAAVQGTSRLPLNSVEAPLPAFSLGQLAYLPRTPDEVTRDAPLTTWQELLDVPLVPLETLLRSLSPDRIVPVVQRLKTADVLSRLRRLFNDVSLSPYTGFVDTTLAFVGALVQTGTIQSAEEADLWSWLLRQLGRHLTAYDLITFHYRGANYPDALLLDAVLRRYARLAETQPELFHQGGAKSNRLRRRALRQACLLRRYYEGQAVPDAPTSPGENARVLPPPHVRVPDEQLLNVLRRRKRLYAGEPLTALLGPSARAVLRESILDLAEPREWAELGTAVFIDRPFGWGKAVGEPDQTPLLAHETYSPSIARRRFQELGRLARELNLEDIDWASPAQQENMKVLGLPAAQVAEPDRPVTSLADARRVADDFAIVRTLRQGKGEALDALDFGDLAFSRPEAHLVVRVPSQGDGTVLAFYDDRLHKRLEAVTDLSRGFCRRGRREMPAAGLRVVRLWDQDGREHPADRTINLRFPTG